LDYLGISVKIIFKKIVSVFYGIIFQILVVGSSSSKIGEIICEKFPEIETDIIQLSALVLVVFKFPEIFVTQR
jgi:hypothetical protein